MKKREIVSLIIFGVLVAALFSACASEGGPVSTEIPSPISPTDTGKKIQEPGTPAEAAVAELARQLDIDPGIIEVVSIDSIEWPNSCLGVPAAGEMCLDVITSGYLGILDANGIRYEFHSDKRGEEIHFIPSAALSAREALAQELGMSSDSVQLVSFEQMMWPNSCLGVEMSGQMCLDVITPGFRVVLQTNGEQYIYHTDKNGDNLVVAESSQSDIDASIIHWSQSDGTGCQQALISQQEVSYGSCEGPLTAIPVMSDMNVGDFRYLMEKYSPFEAKTAAGEISFKGRGSLIASPAEQRMIAEWAKLTKQVAEAGRAGAAWGLALAWHREGGVAGLCDDLVIHLYGTALASSCKLGESSNSARIYLNADQLEQLYGWVDGLSSFVYEQTDPGTTDAMSIYMEFDGNGDGAAADKMRSAILDFAAQMYAQAIENPGTE